MKQTKLAWIQDFLFDPEIKDMVMQKIFTNKYVTSARTKWRGGLNGGRHKAVPEILDCPEKMDEVVWVLIRTVGDIELHRAVALDPFDSEDTFRKTPLGIQRAIAIHIPDDDETPVNWTLYTNIRMEETGNHFRYGMHTFTKERTPLNQLSFEERERRRNQHQPTKDLRIK